MAIKNKDGSIYSFTKPPPVMEEQSFWGKKEPIVMHNKLGKKYHREKLEEDVTVEEPVQKEVQVPEFEEAKVEETQQEEIQIVKAIEESKPKHVSEDIVEVWCLPCLEYTENTDPLYDESYAKIKYGETFKFRSRIRLIEDLYIQFITETNVELPAESVIYPIMKNRRWWRVKGVKEVKGFYIYMAIISDYQPTFAAQSN